MTYQKLAYILNKIEPGLYKKFKMNVAKEKTPTDITEYDFAHSIIFCAFSWNNTTSYPNRLIWLEVYNILIKQEL